MKATIKRLNHRAICSRNHGLCSDIGGTRYKCTFYDVRGRYQVRTFCTYHAVKFALHHDLIRELSQEDMNAQTNEQTKG